MLPRWPTLEAARLRGCEAVSIPTPLLTSAWAAGRAGSSLGCAAEERGGCGIERAPAPSQLSPFDSKRAAPLR